MPPKEHEHSEHVTDGADILGNETVATVSPARTEVEKPSWTSDPLIIARGPWNLAVLAYHQILFRIAWVFKTESIVFPAIIDWLIGAGAGPIRGILPILSRVGQSFPPVLLADRMRRARRKMLAPAVTTMAIAISMALMGVVCHLGQFDPSQKWLVPAVLTTYFLFCVSFGIYRISAGTLKGKLIRPERRGRLLLVSTFWGAIPSAILAYLFLGPWFTEEPLQFHMSCYCAAIGFFFASICLFLVKEPKDKKQTKPPKNPRENISELWSTFRGDPTLRLLTLIVAIFGSGLIVLPHYQALRVGLGLSSSHLVYWIIAQSTAVGCFSLIVGPSADRFGNRLTMRFMMFGATLSPLLAALLPLLPHPWGGRFYWLVFVTLTLQPLVLRIVANYTLEICANTMHARYLSTINLCQVFPFLFSPFVGYLFETVNTTYLMLTIAALMLAAALMTFRLPEPRHDT